VSAARQIACALMRHAARIMPAARADWSAAMEGELGFIENDTVALHWALGCVIAGYRERISDMLQTWYARSALACLIVLLALREFFAPLLIFAYRMQYLGLAHFLGLRTAGDDYRRLIPVMDATPSWLAALWVAAGFLYFQVFAETPNTFGTWTQTRDQRMKFALDATQSAMVEMLGFIVCFGSWSGDADCRLRTKATHQRRASPRKRARPAVVAESGDGAVCPVRSPIAASTSSWASLTSASRCAAPLKLSA